MPTDPKSKKLFLLLGGAAAFAILLILGTNALLKLIPAGNPGTQEILPGIQSDPNQTGIPREPDTQTVEPGVLDRRPIIYTADGFQPARVTVSITDEGTGCLITVTNRTASPLKVGVNPHAAAGDPGADYGFIQPGQTSILDVRYSGLSEITLHDHQNPAHEFTVVYGQGC
ncbi:MAG: hypothetical protein HY473_00880 [Candidatus Sungbacteria bacterium]|uniref:Uncharacterized protein n=1 Tax=Candidatus Sungiibacteriota bacterium TaxID=2750080 RepID=A0A933DRS8_9BACT|nr:hypothetical protein [Candidatus Sungbacteria bacterium]